MMPPGLSSRQKVLFDRLASFGEWIESKKLPINVKEVFGFGSFFRGKASPKDVDLLVVYHAELTPEFAHFLRLLEIIRKKTAFQGKYDTPKDALIAQLRREAETGSPETSNVEEGVLLFESWLEKYSWSMHFPAAWYDQLAVTNLEEFTRRLVRRHFANLNVVRYCRYNPDFDETIGLRCGFKVSVWNEDQTDIAVNLGHLLSSGTASQNARRDLEYFQVQLPVIPAQVQVLCDEIRLLLRTSMRSQKDHALCWLEEIGKSDHDIAAAKSNLEKAELAAKRFDKEREKAQSPPMSDKPDGDVIEQAMEWRSGIKDRYTQLDVLEWARGACCATSRASEIRESIRTSSFTTSYDRPVAQRIARSGEVFSKRRAGWHSWRMHNTEGLTLADSALCLNLVA